MRTNHEPCRGTLPICCCACPHLNPSWNKFHIAASCSGGWQKWGKAVLGQQYLVRQATTLLKFAKSVGIPNVPAALVEKAADLRDRKSPRQMTPQVFIRRHTASQICDVVVSVRGQEIILRCPNYSQALKWARLECKSYKISEPEIEPPNGLEHDEDDGLDHVEELPIFLRSPETIES
jgi:hypothetical protein